MDQKECAAQLHVLCNAGPILHEVRSAIGELGGKMSAVQHAQALLVDQVSVLDRKTTHALETANEAKKQADAARIHTDDMVAAMRHHFDVVSRTMTQQGSVIEEQAKTLSAQTATLSAHTVVLDLQTKELGQQSKALELLTQAEMRRGARETLLEQYAKEQREWIRWSIPILFTLLSGLIGVLTWFITKVK